MTVSDDHPPKADDPQASLRTELVGQLAGAELALEAAIAELSRDSANGNLVATSRTQLASLTSLRRQVGNASGATLADLRAEVTAAASSAAALAQQATANASAQGPQDAASRVREARQSIESIGHDLYDRHVLDPYLQFANAEDEAAYRKREEERRRAYEAELEKDTAAGDRRAAEIVQSQLADAKAHGADRSPEFAGLLSRTEGAASTLQPTSDVTTTAGRNGVRLGEPSAASTQPAGDKDVDAITAALKATGVVVEPATNEPTHGVPALGKVASAARPVTRS